MHDTALQYALEEAAKQAVEESRGRGAQEGKMLWIIAYRDDIYIVADAEMAAIANTKVDEVREQMTGVKESKHKTRAYCPALAHSDAAAHARAITHMQENTYIRGEMITSVGLEMLGAPLGGDRYIADSLNRTAHKYPNFLPRLTTMDTQTALILLRECHLPIATHLIRMIHPDHTRPHAKELDENIANTFIEITGQGLHSTEKLMDTASQPYKHAGLALRSQEALAPIAHFACRLQSTQLLAQIDPSIAQALDEATHQESPPPTPPPLGAGKSESVGATAEGEGAAATLGEGPGANGVPLVSRPATTPFSKPSWGWRDDCAWCTALTPWCPPPGCAPSSV